MEQSLSIEIRAKSRGWLQGVSLTLLLAIAARMLSKLPFLSIMGPLVLAILLGIAWRSAIGVPANLSPGISFASKKLLRIGIILLGIRLNFADIANAGPGVVVIAIVNITFALVVIYSLSKVFRVEKRLGLLTAVGTAICGAAAIVAVAPQIKAKEEETAVGVTIIALLGTLFTVIYSLLYPVLGLAQNAFGLFAGSTLHEIAHVVAAAAPFGSTSLDTAVIVKLTRVALLIPVSLLLALFAARSEKKSAGTAGSSNSRIDWKAIQFPWFIVGFLAMSGVSTLEILPASFSDLLLSTAYLLMAMAMGGLGLNVAISSFRTLGGRALFSTLIGSLLLSALGYLLVLVWYS